MVEILITPASFSSWLCGRRLARPDAVLPSPGGTHLGLHEEDCLHPGLRPSLAGGLLELSHMVSLLDLRAGGGALGSERPPVFTQEPDFFPRHLQRFWGASGHFWQAQWERLLLTFEGKEWILFVTGELPRPPAPRAWVHDCSSFPDGLFSTLGLLSSLLQGIRTSSLSQW